MPKIHTYIHIIQIKLPSKSNSNVLSSVFFLLRSLNSYENYKIMDSSTGMRFILNQIHHQKLGYESKNRFFMQEPNSLKKLQKCGSTDVTGPDSYGEGVNQT